ncbi:MAG: acylphosphatase [Candidatus Aenigmarchaeota archaeon]|nr:acylphosphatase [Candidatus Aenigmarchaeota archaeon]
MAKRVHVLVYGRVQGVSFRRRTAEAARHAGIAGWVRNLANGSVEAVFEGGEKAVEQMLDFCRSGPVGAKVEKLVVHEEIYIGKLQKFVISYQLGSR